MARLEGARTLLAFLVLALVQAAAALGLFVPRAAAQDLPPDVAVLEEPQRALPDAGPGYVRELRGAVQWEFPERAASIVRDLQEVYAAEWPRVTEELGGDIDPALEIRIGRDPEAMRALAPPEAPPPAYASGVAYPARGLVLLTLTAPETWQRPDLDAVLVHELSHIALHRAVDGNPTPRWFGEGVAIHQARERSLERMRALWGATVGDRLLPLERLSSGFPSQPHRVNLAYAQSADFVRWLRGREDGERKFRDVIRRIENGQSFESALERTYSVNMTRLELDWHANLGERYQAMPLLFGSGTLWVFAAALIVIAYARRRRKDRAKLDEWEREEREALAVAHAAGADRHVLALTSVASRSRDDDHDVLYVIPPEPRGRESGIPTIEHEGRNHTLH